MLAQPGHQTGISARRPGIFAEQRFGEVECGQLLLGEQARRPVDQADDVVLGQPLPFCQNGQRAQSIMAAVEPGDAQPGQLLDLGAD
tara:strand:+ start:569 stop:829 length:261 start_codon:yes stop_codon:yes gene_type:complete